MTIAAKLLVLVAADTKQAKKELTEVTKELQGFGGGLVKAGKALTIGLTAPAALAAAGIVKLSMSMEQSKIAFSTMLKSGQKAEAFLESLRDFAAKTPFEFMELQDAARRMLAFGFEASKVLPMLTDIGDAVSGLGLGSDGINRVTLALGQMQAKSKVSAQEMMQLTEAGIPAWRYLAQSMGLSTAEVMKLSEKGLVPAGEAIEAILAGMRQDFGGMMAEQSKTAAGQLSNLKDELVALGTELGDILLPTVKDLIAAARDAMEAFSGLSDESKKSLVNIGLGLIALGPALTILGKLTVALSALPAVISGVATAWKAWQAGMTLSTALGAAGLSPIVIGLGSVALAVGAVVAVWALWNKIMKEGQRVREETKDAWKDFFDKQVESGKDATQIVKAYREEQERLRKELQDQTGPKVVISENNKLVNNLEGLNQTLALTSKNYRDYSAAMMGAGYGASVYSLQEWEAARATQALAQSQAEAMPASAAFAGQMSETSLRVQAAAQAARDASEANRVALKASFDEMVASAQTTKTELENLTGQYDSLKQKMDDWVSNTAGQVVDMLGNKFSEASEKYRSALAEVDDLMGTNYVKQLEAKDAVENLVNQYARTGDLNGFREGLQKIKDEGLADMQAQLEQVTEKAQALYDKLLALPETIRIKIDFIETGMPGWVQSGTAPTPNTIPVEKYSKHSDENDRALGGPVRSGRPYIVGEVGPELFVPETNGQIIPNNEIYNQPITINATLNRDLDIYLLAQEVAGEIRRNRL